MVRPINVGEPIVTMLEQTVRRSALKFKGNYGKAISISSPLSNL